MATSLNRLLFDSPKTNDALLFMTILSTDLKALKRRGYNGTYLYSDKCVLFIHICSGPNIETAERASSSSGRGGESQECATHVETAATPVYADHHYNRPSDPWAWTGAS